MLRVIAFVMPCVLWLFLMRDFVFGAIPVNMDTNTIYGVTKFYFNNLLNGVIPLWEPFVSLGRPFYAISICNLFNPFTLIVPVLKILGMNYAHAFVAYMVIYFFVGCAGFYFLAVNILQDRRLAYLSYLAIIFSSLGTSMFTQFTFLEIFVPTLWFFLFLLRFASRQTKGYFFGLTFTVMLVISSYLPFYFMTAFLCFGIVFSFLYFKQTKIFLNNFIIFMARHWRLSVLAVIGVLLAAAPLLAYKILDASGDVVAPGRHCQYSSAQECYDRTMGRQGGMSYDEITRSGSLAERLDMQYIFGNLDKISYGSDSFFFLPFWIYVTLGISLFLPVKRLTVLLSSMAVLISLIAVGHSSGLHGFLYRHIFFFAYFRNLFFLGAFLIPIMILLAFYQLKTFLGMMENSDVKFNATTVQKGIITGVVFWHLIFLFILKHYQGVSVFSYLTLGLSTMVLSLYFLVGLRFSKTLWTGIFAILLLIQPVWVLKSYAFNAHEFETILPSMHVMPVFAWVRPLKAAVNQSRIYQFVHYEDFWYDMSMTDAPPLVGFPQSTTRWTFDLSEHTPEDVLAHYAQYKILLYDDLHSAGTPVLGASQKIAVDYFDVNTLRLKTSFSKSQIVVYNDSYTSSWKAFVDGMPVALIRANQAFKGIDVPAGEHLIAFSYHPPGGRWVYLMASAALLFFLILTIILLRARAEGLG